MSTYLIVGLGRFGSSMARKLHELGGEVMVIDNNSDQVQKIANYVTYAVVGDAQDEDVLSSLGVRNVDCAVVAIGEDLAATILITLNLKSQGVPHVICKARDELQKKALEKIGADRVVIPEREMGIKMAQNLVSSSVLDYIELSRECGIAEIMTPKPWAGKTIRQLNIRAKFGVNIIALRHGEDDVITVAMEPEYVLQESDIMVILGNNEDLMRVQRL